MFTSSMVPTEKEMPLAERAIESPQTAIANGESAVATAKRVLALATSLQDQLLKARCELLAYTACGMETDTQIAELHRLHQRD